MLRWRVQKPDRVPPHVRRQVGVAKRHIHRGVPHELLDGLERHAAHRQVGREGVPQHMPAKRQLLAPGRFVGSLRQCSSIGPEVGTPSNRKTPSRPCARLAAVRLTPGTRVGPYEVVALLGAGGMAEVYRAKDTRLGREVAIKVVSETLGRDGAFLERFDREAKLAASLAHPNVVALHDVGFHDGKPYFVTELLQGESLRERLAQGPLPVGKALEWAAQMAQGLAAAHERGIVHRDLKPENIFVTKAGHVKLLDFGIAKLIETAQAATPHDLMDPTLSPSGSSTGTGMVLGTPGYMSPEQVRGDPVDARTDFFGLGAVLYEMLSGRRAFPSGPTVETGYAVLHSEPEPLLATVPPQVAQVVYRCLEKDPARRFQTASDLAFNLELVRALTGPTAPSKASGWGPQIQGWRRWLWPVTAVLAALGAAGATYFVIRGGRPLTPSVEQLTLRRGTVTAARFTPDGRVVYSAAWGAEPEQLFTHAPGSPDTQSLGVRGARLLSVSPQGELAVSLHPVGHAWGLIGGELALVPSVGGVPRELTNNIVYADWSPTGELAVVRSVGGKRQLEFPLGTPLFSSNGYIGFPRVSPRGDMVAFFSAPTDPVENELLVVDRRGAVRSLYKSYALSGLAWSPSGDEVWFTEKFSIWASPLSGGRRLVYSGLTSMALQDISPDGKLLMEVGDAWWEIVFVPAASSPERELSWARVNILASLSDDGRRALVSAGFLGTLTYLQPTDGSPALKLGKGLALAFSPDEKWVLTTTFENNTKLSLLPVGMGVPKTLPLEGLTVLDARWLRDGKRIVVVGHGGGEKEARLYLAALEGGAATRLSDASVWPDYVEVSHDDRLAAANSLDGTLTLFPLDGTPPIPLADLGPGSVPVGWTQDGQLWVLDQRKGARDAPIPLLRYDVSSRRVVEQRTLSPMDVTGLEAVGRICITPDGRALAYQRERRLSHLDLVDGLALPRR
jgi:eukaryotic-like serine/threonine-protein kinase